MNQMFSPEEIETFESLPQEASPLLEEPQMADDEPVTMGRIRSLLEEESNTILKAQAKEIERLSREIQQLQSTVKGLSDLLQRAFPASEEATVFFCSEN